MRFHHGHGTEKERNSAVDLPTPMNRRSFASAFTSFSIKAFIFAALLGAAATLTDALLLAGIRGGAMLLAADGEVKWGSWILRPDFQTALRWSLALTGIIVLRFFIGSVRWSRIARYATRFEERVRLNLIAAPVPKGGSERSAHRFTHDLSFLRRGGEHLHQFVQALLQLAVFVPWMAVLSWELTLVMLVVLAPLVSLMQRKLHRVGVPIGVVMSKVDRLGRDFEAWIRLRENWTSSPSLTRVQEELQSDATSLSELSWKIEAQRARLVGGAELVSGIATLLVLVGSGILLRTGRLSIADLVAFCGALLLCYRPLREGFRLPPVLRDAQVAWERLRALASSPLPQPREYSVDETFVADQLSFAYGSRFIFKNANWRLSVDQPIMFIGANGSGKTTLLKILAGLYSPYSGRVLYPRCSQGREISYLAQDPVTPRWISLVHRDAEERTLLEVLRLPQTNGSAEGILETGYSGGELQRVALAAVLLQDAKIVLLDEPVSKMPYEERASVMEAVRLYCKAKGRYLLLSSHESYPGFVQVKMDELRGWI